MSDNGTIEGIREIKITDDLYIWAGVYDGYVDLHSCSSDEDGNTGVLIGKEELDDLIEALMQLRKELEED